VAADRRPPGGRDQAHAAWLVVSPATAKTHVSRILAKLGLRDRAQLVIAAYESGLITPGG
jgi:DNA-binding NarL/FixJ family response regulator